MGSPSHADCPQHTACWSCSEAWKQWKSQQLGGDVITNAPAFAGDTNTSQMAARGWPYSDGEASHVHALQGWL